jgi:hypothetical protein
MLYIIQALLALFLVWVVKYSHSTEYFDMSKLTGHSFELEGQKGKHQERFGNFYFYFKDLR